MGEVEWVVVEDRCGAGRRGGGSRRWRLKEKREKVGWSTGFDPVFIKLGVWAVWIWAKKNKGVGCVFLFGIWFWVI